MKKGEEAFGELNGKGDEIGEFDWGGGLGVFIGREALLIHE